LLNEARQSQEEALVRAREAERALNDEQAKGQEASIEAKSAEDKMRSVL